MVVDTNVHLTYSYWVYFILLVSGAWVLDVVVTVLRREDVLVLSKSSVASHKAFLLKVIMSPFTSPDISACLFYSLFRSSQFAFRVPACTSTHITWHTVFYVNLFGYQLGKELSGKCWHLEPLWVCFTSSGGVFIANFSASELWVGLT